MNKIFLSAPAGLVPWTLREAADLGLVDPQADQGEKAAEVHPLSGIEIASGAEQIYRANLHLRTATRIFLQLGAFYVSDLAALRHHVSRLPWQRYMASGQSLLVRAESSQSRLFHEHAVEREVSKAVIERAEMLGFRLRIPAEQETPDHFLMVEITRNRCTIRLDTSGEALNRRGYRQALAKAPLRETLAAGMLLASEWDRVSPLVDPFCGSGTIPIEAALLARKVPPGWRRAFAFQKWPSFQADLWEGIRAAAEQKIEKSSVPIYGMDRDAGAVNACLQNAERAGAVQWIHFRQQAISDLPHLPGPGWVVTNPPYGQRVSAGSDLRNLYARFGDVLRSSCRSWRFAILCSDETLFRQTRLVPERALPMFNGAIAVKCFIGQIK